MRRHLLPMLLVLLLAAWAGVLPAQHEQINAEEFREISRRVLDGEPVEEEAMNALRRAYSRFLIQPPMHVGQAARYEIAETLMARGDIRNAILRLQEITAPGVKEDEVVWVTRFNVAELLYVGMNDVDQAVIEFGKVKGNLEALAQREMLIILENDPNRQAQVVALLERRAGETRDRGEQFALLMRLGRYYKKQKQPDKAIEVFERVAREATPEVVEGIRKKIVEDVRAAGKKVRALHEQNRHQEADEVRMRLHRRAGQLRVLDRNDEAEILERALDRLDADEDVGGAAMGRAGIIELPRPPPPPERPGQP
jgi:tetratricopeptide (TPR) repeat protein